MSLKCIFVLVRFTTFFWALKSLTSIQNCKKKKKNKCKSLVYIFTLKTYKKKEKIQKNKKKN